MLLSHNLGISGNTKNKASKKEETEFNLYFSFYSSILLPQDKDSWGEKRGNGNGAEKSWQDRLG